MTKNTIVIFIVGVTCLIVGYFAGREHVKYEIRSSFFEAGKVFSEGMQQVFGGDSDTDEIHLAESKTTNLIADQNDISNIEPHSPDPIAFGQSFVAPEFEISITDAKIDRPQVKDMFDDVVLGNNPQMILVFRVKNTHDRKILRYHKENMFLAGNFKMRDDVDNVIRNVDYGTGTPVGALTGSEDILPGNEITHVVIFSVPPPKTKYLILTMDLCAFGGEGETRFKIDAENIKKFPPEE